VSNIKLPLRFDSDTIDYYGFVITSGRLGSDLVTLIGYNDLSWYWLSSEKNEMGKAYGTRETGEVQ
jgi:hypothetical protein